MKPGGTGRPAHAMRLKLAPLPPAIAVTSPLSSLNAKTPSAENFDDPCSPIEPDTLSGLDGLRCRSRTDDGGNAELARHDSRMRQRAARIGDETADLCEQHDP